MSWIKNSLVIFFVSIATIVTIDAVGYIFREGEETMISFDSLDDIVAGSRCEHLKGKTMPLEWSKIFID